MASSKTEIINLGGQILGAPQVIEGEEPDNRAARELNLAYGPNLDELLSSWDWNFARDRASIPKLGSVPAFKYKFEYALPEEAVKVWSIDENYSRFGGENDSAGRLDGALNGGFIGGGGDAYASGTQFDVEGGKIRTDKDIITDLNVVNIPGLPVTFTKRVTQVSLYPAWFVTALYTRLAMQTAEAISASNTLFNRSAALFDDAIKKARWQNANEGVQKRPLSTFLAVKG